MNFSRSSSFQSLVFGSACALLLSSALGARAQLAPPDEKDTLTLEAMSPLVGGPSLVTLQGKDVPLQTAVDALLKAGDLSSEKALSADDVRRTVTVNWKDTPFWEAARDLEAQTGLQWEAYFIAEYGRGLQLSPRGNTYGREIGLTGLSGAHTALGMVVANDISRQSLQNMVFRDGVAIPRTRATTYLRMSAYLDPHFRILPGSMQAELTNPNKTGFPSKDLYSSPGYFSGGSLIGISSFRLALDSLEQAKVPLVQGTSMPPLFRSWIYGK